MMEIKEVTNTGWDTRIRMFRAGQEVDTFVVCTQRFTLIVDTMSAPEEIAQVMEQVQDEIARRPLLVLNTHQHYDHVWGNALFDLDGPFPAPILATEKSAKILREQRAAIDTNLEARQIQNPRFANVRIVPPTLSFSDRLTLDGTDLTLELIPAPGHSEDQVVVWIPEVKILLAADALEFPFPAVNNPADLPKQFETMRLLQTLGAEVVLPCHGGIFGPELIAMNLEYFTRLQTAAKTSAIPEDWQTRNDLPELMNRSFGSVAAELGISELPDFYQDFHLRNLRAALHNR